MKRKSVVAATLAASTFVIASCHLFGLKPAKDTNLSFIGQWRLDSMRIGKDSSLFQALTLMTMKDSGGVNVEFRKDTLLTRTRNSVDTLLYSYDDNLKRINLKDSSEQPLIFVTKTDSALTLQGADSTLYFLKKQ